MTPPGLPRDGPGPDILHPVVVGLDPGARMELDASSAHRLEGDLGEGLDVDIPLARDQRLHRRLAAIAEADGMAIGLDALDQAELLHVLNDRSEERRVGKEWRTR